MDKEGLAALRTQSLLSAEEYTLGYAAGPHARLCWGRLVPAATFTVNQLLMVVSCAFKSEVKK